MQIGLLGAEKAPNILVWLPLLVTTEARGLFCEYLRLQDLAKIILVCDVRQAIVDLPISHSKASKRHYGT